MSKLSEIITIKKKKKKKKQKVTQFNKKKMLKRLGA